MSILYQFLKISKKCFDFSVYYTFLLDLYLIEFFSRKYNYLIFIFSFTFGTFGYDNNLSQHQFLFKFSCFLFSWYLVYASIIVFISFNIPVTKNYLYELLGKEFVISKIGNPGLDGLARFGGFAALGLFINETGRIVDGYATTTNAEKALETALKAIRDDPYLTDKQKSAETVKALDDKSS